MTLQRFLLVSFFAGLLMLSTNAAWAAGTRFAAIEQPVSDTVVTIQWVVGIMGTLGLVLACILAMRHEAAGLVGIVFAAIILIIAFKIPDIIQAWGPSRALASSVNPVVITAGQQILDACQTLLVNSGWLLLATEGLRRARQADRI